MGQPGFQGRHGVIGGQLHAHFHTLTAAVARGSTRDLDA
jgi:hypothetical protein